MEDLLNTDFSMDDISAQDIHNGFDKLIEISEFFYGIVHKIAALLQPVFKDLLDKI